MKALLKRGPIFNFNLTGRDAWVRGQAPQVPEGSLLLDLGAGSCPYRSLFAHCQYKSQDFAALTDEQLRDRSGYGKIDYVCDATAIPVPDGYFDAVLCTEVLEHVPEPIKVLGEISRVLKPGGRLLLTAPLGSGLHQEPYHYYGGYTPYWYDRFLRQFGFDPISVTPNGGFFKHYGQESIRFVKLLSPWASKSHWVVRWSLLPIWVLMVPWFGVAVPVLCHFLDRLDKDRKFTIGYHVVARKRAPK